MTAFRAWLAVAAATLFLISASPCALARPGTEARGLEDAMAIASDASDLAQPLPAPPDDEGGGADDAGAEPAVGSLLPARDVLVWMMRLNSSQCTSAAASPCYNLYCINSTTGELLWFAYRWAGRALSSRVRLLGPALGACEGSSAIGRRPGAELAGR
jgi:hypothetical protein